MTVNNVAMVTHDFIKLFHFLFNMNTLVSDQSLLMTYTNRFCVTMLAVFATYNPSEAALTVLSRDRRYHISSLCQYLMIVTVELNIMGTYNLYC